jgi:chromosome segregation ATPase
VTVSNRNGELRIRQLELEVARLQERLTARAEALRLQADEYERRLDVLNHAHEEAREVASRTVSRKEFEDYVKATGTAREQAVKTEADKRELALLRVDEKFQDYVKRYEQRQREVDQALTIQKTASEAAKQFAADAAQKAQLAVAEQASETNLRMGVLGLFLSAVVIVVNFVT